MLSQQPVLFPLRNRYRIYFSNSHWSKLLNQTHVLVPVASWGYEDWKHCIVFYGDADTVYIY